MIYDNASQNTTILLCGGSQVNDNMFRPFYLFQLGHHQVKRRNKRGVLQSIYNFYKYTIIHIILVKTIFTL
jgi:hypothetical protein